MSKAIEELAEQFARMPGIGPRQARRIVQFLLRSNESYRTTLARGITDISQAVSQCTSCYMFDEVNSDSLCARCSDATRSTNALMVVEKDVDVDGIEQVGVHNGYYFVLGALIPLTNRKHAVEPRTTLLYKKIQDTPELKEIILGFATTPEGDNTAREIRQYITEHFPKLTISSLGRGLSLGAEIEYADQETLRSAFKGRH